VAWFRPPTIGWLAAVQPSGKEYFFLHFVGEEPGTSFCVLSKDVEVEEVGFLSRERAQ
jgi:hypothetical protein